jgi:hypothetical protein
MVGGLTEARTLPGPLSAMITAAGTEMATGGFTVRNGHFRPDLKWAFRSGLPSPGLGLARPTKVLQAPAIGVPRVVLGTTGGRAFLDVECRTGSANAGRSLRPLPTSAE